MPKRCCELDNVMSGLHKVQRPVGEQTDAIQALKIQTRAATSSGSSEGSHVEEVRRLSHELQVTHAELAKASAERDTAVASLQSEGALRSELEEQIGRLQAERDELQGVATELKQKGERLQSEIVTVQKELSAAHKERQTIHQAIEKMKAAAQAVRREKEDLLVLLNTADERQRENSAALEGEHKIVVALSQDRDACQRQLQMLHEELTQAREALTDADRHISRLGQANDRLKTEGTRIGMQHLDNELPSQELPQDLSQATHRIDEMSQTLPAVHGYEAQTQPEGQPVDVLLQEDNLERPGPETTKNHVLQKKSLDADDISKDQHIDLTKTHEALRSVFEAEIAHGDIKVDQLGDQLIVKLKKRALFSSGQSELHAKGLTVLRRASDVFKSFSDKHIRIEGYTPYSPASVNLQERVRFQSNWMLSGERAIAAIQYLTEKGGVPSSNISAVGFAVRLGPVIKENSHTSMNRVSISDFMQRIQVLPSSVKVGVRL
jgi:flagellar motor protein MotB